MQYNASVTFRTFTMIEKRLPGVYKIVCDANGQEYVGSSVHIPARWRGHQRALERRKHPNRHLQSCWDKYGARSFRCEILEVVANHSRLLHAEQAWMDSLKPRLNLSPTATSTYGTKLSAATCARIRDARLKWPRVWTDGDREAHSRALRGIVRSPETRARMRAAQAKRFADGWQPSLEQRQRHSAIMKGRKHTPEHNRKIGEGQRGRTHTEATKRRMREAWVRRKQVLMEHDN